MIDEICVYGVHQLWSSGRIYGWHVPLEAGYCMCLVQRIAVIFTLLNADTTNILWPQDLRAIFIATITILLRLASDPII